MKLFDSPLLLVARQELVLSVRSRLTQLFAAAFGALSLAVALSGYALSGGYGFQDFARTSASLVQLVCFLVPLASLVLGALSLSPERGAAELLFSQPVPRTTILVGQLLGIFGALAGAELVGFGAAGVAIFFTAGEEGGAAYALVVASALLLTAIFLGISGALSAGAVGRKRARALGLSLVAWFSFALLLDVAVMAVASGLSSWAASRLIIVSVLLNPVSAVRTGTLLAVEGTAAFGTASLALLRFAGGPWGAGLCIGASAIFWLVAPLWVAAFRQRRADF